MPTRLIDVSSAPTHIRLVKVTPGDHTPYIALSYCWGESHPLVTEKQSLAQHMDDIPITKLPWTILDAVKVARWLGVQYIWVDALCIVQDCEHDKELEMARMQQVFQNAYLTIVAAQARSCREGFLKTDNHWNELAALPVRCENGAIGTMRLRARRARAADDDNDDDGHHGREPVHERGWTLQEVLLSPRLLVYGRMSVVWKCFCFDQGRTCNPSSSPSDWNGYCAAAGLTTIRLCPSGRIVQPAATVTMPHLRLFPDSAYAELLPRLYRVWEHVVQDYSNRRLTNPADKPAALSGVVGYFQRALRDDTYVAGLWKAQFMHELCWTVVAGESAVAADGVRPDVWRAPSWSWLSVDAAVAFEANAHTWFEPAARLLAAEAVPVVAAAPFSRLRRGAWLRLRGCLLSAWEACFYECYNYS
ncbi:putative het-domain-containing protein [Neofusicoccum parvum]|uniref:Het-domain-containing protein n=1 Tax=Neofusicoccum parvum TaxID=310453 RepID=A0ACB5S8T6_9PEZI|nr:putative het-domain-containing protein [Neofusicoccum parvum]